MDKIHTDISGALQVQIFTGQWGPHDQEMLLRWYDLADGYGLLLNVKIIELFDAPELARKFNIVCTPTTIISYDNEQSLRCVGYNEKIDRFIRYHEMHKKAQTMQAVTKQMHDEASKMIRDSKELIKANKRLQDGNRELPDVTD